MVLKREIQPDGLDFSFQNSSNWMPGVLGAAGFWP